MSADAKPQKHATSMLRAQVGTERSHLLGARNLRNGASFRTETVVLACGGFRHPGQSIVRWVVSYERGLDGRLRVQANGGRPPFLGFCRRHTLVPQD